MAESLYELLEPYLQSSALWTRSGPSAHLSALVPTQSYLSQLTTCHLAELATGEPQSLIQARDKNDLSLRTLASRSHRTVISSSDNLSTLQDSLPAVASGAKSLKDAIPRLDEEALRFSATYSKATHENKILNRRKRATQLSRNVDKISDILELPTLLASVISSASTNSSSSGTNFSTALDLFAHIKRLAILHPESTIVRSVLSEAEEAMKEMTTNLISSLRGQNIRLAAAIRTIGWLRRVAPDLSTPTVKSTTYTSLSSATDEGLFGTLFLTARLANLLNTLEALSPLRELADQETARRLSRPATKTTSHPTRKPTSSTNAYNPSFGQQTERYLKRYIEIFREQSFATVSMYRNIFPAPESSSDDSSTPDYPLPSALQTFPLHLTSLLTDTLKLYLPNITDLSTRESLLTQVLYAAGSLGRLGADFGIMISLLDEEDVEDEAEKVEDGVKAEDQSLDVSNGESNGQKPEHEQEQIPEWIRVMQKHRIQAGRLEALAAGQDQAGIKRGSSETVVK